MICNTKPNHRANSPPPCGEGLGAGEFERFTPIPRLLSPGSGGFTLVSAIFLMVVLVVLGASLVTLGSVQHATSAQQLQSVRAYYAARAGAEWAAKVAGGCPVGPSNVVEGTFTTLNGFTVSVTCTNVSHTLGAATPKYYVVKSTATSGNYGGTDFVSRQIESKVLR